MRRPAVVLAMIAAASEAALACPICFRVEESATTDGLRAAVLVLVGATVVVLGGFARFMVGFVRRERREPTASLRDTAGTPEC